MKVRPILAASIDYIHSSEGGNISILISWVRPRQKKARANPIATAKWDSQTSSLSVSAISPQSVFLSLISFLASNDPKKQLLHKNSFCSFRALEWFPGNSPASTMLPGAPRQNNAPGCYSTPCSHRRLSLPIGDTPAAFPRAIWVEACG